MVRPEGLEPPAYRFEVCHSIQLSYGRDNIVNILYDFDNKLTTTNLLLFRGDR